MKFKEFYPSQTQNRSKAHHEYDSIINDKLKLMHAIAQSLHEPIRATYPYMSSTESLAIMINTMQQDKEGLVDYMERFKQEKSIVKSSIGDFFR